MSRAAQIVDVRAGCFECHGNGAHWTGKNAMMVAARHAQAHGHATWSEQTLRVTHGEPRGADGRQADLFPLPPSEDLHAA